MNMAKSVKGMDAMAAIIIVTRTDVGSYDAWKSGRKGIGNKTHTQRTATIVSSFHLFLILCFRNEDAKSALLVVAKALLIVVT